MEHVQSLRNVLVRPAFALAALTATSPIWACSGVGPPAKPVIFGDQTNIVIWDEANQVEHFIRNANFRSSAEDFGFIAPTPAKPDLHEASTQAFYTLGNLGPVTGSGGMGGGFGGGAGGFSIRPEVKVIQEADVSGYHATTLWSRSAEAINDWMNKHGYVSTPEVEKWAERYCSRGWYLTAFKVTDRSRLAASTGTIRMSFPTKKPFNPFYVPSTNIQTDRKGTLRVYFVAVGDYEAHIGYREIWENPQWTVPIPVPTAAQLAKQVQLPTDAIPEKAQVETFVDNDFPRPAADDIYFLKKKVVEQIKAAPAQKPIPPVAFSPLLLGFGCLALIRRRKNDLI